MAGEASQSWIEALKARKLVLKRLDKINKDEIAEGKEEAFIGELENTLAEFRLACVQTIFTDFEYAVSQNAEAILWQTHSRVNSEYREFVSRLKSRDTKHDVVRRKVERLYFNFLKTAQYFYRGYIQRMMASCPMPELDRIAKGIEVSAMHSVPPIENVTPAVRQEVIKSCHVTLVHLGDLARYRTQSRHKGQLPDFALVYYSLAQDLNPESGFAHHQMSVIYLEEKKHLKVVYHLHRSIAVEIPHPNAVINLEAEFKSLLLPSTLSSRGAKSEGDAMGDWFVQLHAFFYVGEQFKQHSELESEVMHRFERAVKHGGWAEVSNDLMAMIVVNMAAYYIANEKVKKKWTYAGSQSCQFILRLNVRMMLVLAQVAREELQQVSDRLAVNMTGEERISATLNRVLPLLRFYTSWLASVRLDVVNYEEHLAPFVRDLYRNFAKSLSLLTAVFESHDLSHPLYLLTEDRETVGFKPLDDASLPVFCRLHYDRSNNLKPGRDEAHRRSQNRENVWRIRDIMACGGFLAHDAKFPFTMLAHRVGPDHDVPLTLYVEDPSQLESMASSGLDLSHASGSLRSLYSFMQGTGLFNSSGLTASSAKGESMLPPLEAGTSNSAAAKAADGVCVADSSGFVVDSEVLNRVNDFLSPPEPPSAKSAGASVDESSYGMHTSTANDVFGSLQTPSQKAFPALPWHLIFQPTPQGAGATESGGLPFVPGLEAMSGLVRGNAASPQSVGQESIHIQGQEQLEDPFSSPVSAAVPKSPWAAPPAAAEREQGLKALEQKIAAFSMGNVDPTTGTFGKPSREAAEYMLGQSSSWSYQQSNLSANSAAQAAFPEPSAPSAFPSDAVWGQQGTVQNRNRSPTSPMSWKEAFENASQNIASSSSRPPFPTIWERQQHQVPSHQQQPMNTAYILPTSPPSAQQQYIAVPTVQDIPSSLTAASFFSHPSSLYAGTPMLPPLNVPAGVGMPLSMVGPSTGTSMSPISPMAPPSGQLALGGPVPGSGPALASCNGIAYNATTAYGRGDIASRDDPTAYRNVVRTTAFANAAEAADQYDRDVLRSALLGDGPSASGAPAKSTNAQGKGKGKAVDR